MCRATEWRHRRRAVGRESAARPANPLALTVIIAAVAAALSDTAVDQLAFSLFEIGSVAFGSGMAIVSVLQAEVVQAHAWVSQRELLDGLAPGQVTPGPILITATILGYKLGGILGAALATFTIFSLPIAMTLLFTEIFTRIRRLPKVRSALAGVLAAFVGLLAATLVQLGGAVLDGPLLLSFAAAAFVATPRFKLDIVWVLGSGLALWTLLLATGWAG